MSGGGFHEGTGGERRGGKGDGEGRARGKKFRGWGVHGVHTLGCGGAVQRPHPLTQAHPGDNGRGPARAPPPLPCSREPATPLGRPLAAGLTLNPKPYICAV